MKSSASSAGGEAAIRDIAARWVVRQDRRLSPAEAAELEAWLSADPRHAAAFEQSAASWRLFRDLGTTVRRAPEPLRPRWNWSVAGGLAAVAAIALVVFSFEPESRRAAVPNAEDASAMSAPPVSAPRRLADGSVVRLKDRAEIVEAFSSAERRIRLVRGEAFFAVVKDASRPFLVEVGNVTVQAVGTAFAIRFAPHAVDVLVTEGTVQVTPAGPEQASPRDGDASEAPPALVSAGQRAVVARAPEAETPGVVVSEVSAAEMARTRAWTEPMLELAGATLEEVVAVFTQRTGRRIEIADRALGAVRIGGRFPTDDVDGFVHVLEEVYDVKPERRVDGTIVLRKAR